MKPFGVKSCQMLSATLMLEREGERERERETDTNEDRQREREQTEIRVWERQSARARGSTRET